MVRRERVDQISRVLGCGIGCSHAGSVFSGNALKQGMKDLRRHVARHAGGQRSLQACLIKDVVDIGGAKLLGFLFGFLVVWLVNGDALGLGRPLRRHRAAPRVISSEAVISMRAEFLDGQQLFYNNTLLNDGLELVVDDVDGVDLGAFVAGDDVAGDLRDRSEVSLQQADRDARWRLRSAGRDGECVS